METVQAALAYLARGWCVIPAEPAIRGDETSGKKPLVDWRSFITARPTEDQVRKWWQQWPSANIALVTGRVSGLVVVDVDPRHGGNPRNVFEKNPTGLAVKTGGGGAHLFYAYPPNTEKVQNRVGREGTTEAGIDIRADGGYVIAPPSSHWSGNQYAFVKEDAPAPAPRWAVDAPIIDVQHERDEKWLGDLLGGISKGGRNNACARVAGYFAAKGMAFEIAHVLLDQWNSRNKPPLPHSEVETTLRSVYQTAARNGRLEAARSASKAGVKEVAAEFETMNFGAYMTKFGHMAVQWQIDEWLPEKTIAFVVSPPGSYKSWAMYDLAVSVASGRPFLGHFAVKDPGPVLLIQQEDFNGQIAERLAAITAARFNLKMATQTEDVDWELPPELPIHIHTERKLRFADNTVMAALRAKIDKLRPKLVIIDPLYSAGSTEDFMAKTAEQMFVLKRIRDDTGASFVVVHHTSKQKKDDSDRESPQREKLWGSQFLNAFLETGWQIRPTDQKNAVTIRRHFKVRGDSPLLRVTFDIETEKEPRRYEIAHEEVDDNESNLDLTGVLERLGPSTAQRVAEEVHLHRSSVSRRLNKLVKEGVVEKDAEGKFTMVVLPAF